MLRRAIIFFGDNYLLLTTWLICCCFDLIWHWACLNFSDNLTKQVKEASLLESCSHPQTTSGNLPSASINMSLSFPREQSCSFLSKHEMVRYTKVPKKRHLNLLGRHHRWLIQVDCSSSSSFSWPNFEMENSAVTEWNLVCTEQYKVCLIISCLMIKPVFSYLDDQNHLLQMLGLIKIWSYPIKIRSWSLLFFSKGWVEQQLVLHRTDDWQRCHRRSRRCLGKETDTFGQLRWWS